MYKYKINVYPIVMQGDFVEWVARFPEVNNIGGGGNTPEEAMKDAYANLAFELECIKESGGVLPIAAAENTYSGKLSLRIPKLLHKEIAEISEEDGVSINQTITTMLSDRVGYRKGSYTAVAKGFEKGLELGLSNTIGGLIETAKFALDNDSKISKLCSKIEGYTTYLLESQLQSLQMAELRKQDFYYKFGDVDYEN